MASKKALLAQTASAAPFAGCLARVQNCASKLPRRWAQKMKYGYAYEKLTASVESLATRAGRVQERLRDAWEQFRRLEATHLPPDLWHELQKINARVTDVPPELRDSPRAREEGLATVAFESLDDDQACELARILYDLQFKAAELYRASLPPHLR